MKYIRTKPKQPVLIDIMIDGLFACQMKYNKRGRPEMIDGEVVEVFKLEDIENYVYERRPSLKTKNIKIEFSNQRVY